MAETQTAHAAEKKPARPREFEILTPSNPLFTGDRAGVRFVEGAGRTTDKAAADECFRLGYVVRDCTEPARFEIRTPPASSAFTGVLEGVFFWKGIGHTDDARAAEKFDGGDDKYEGYEVTERDKPRKAAAK